MLAPPGYYKPSYMLNAKLNLLQSCPNPLKNRERIRLHLGTGEFIARVIVLEKQDLSSGQSTFVQLRLESFVVADYGDRYVIRSFSPARTIGGGTIVEVHPPKLKYLPEDELKRLAILEKADPHDIVEQYLIKNEYSLISVTNLAKELSLIPEEVTQVLETLRDRNRITIISEKPEWSVVHSTNFNHALDSIVAFLTNFHQNQPMLKGIKKSELKERLFGKIANPLFDDILDALLQKNLIKSEAEKIARSDHEIKFN